MIDIDTRLAGDITAGINNFEAKIKQQVLLSGVAAMARIFYDEVLLNTSGARKGGAGDPPGVVTGTLHNAVYRAYSPERSEDATKIYHVSVNKSKAPHWWLIEFGSSRHPAHPYIRPALNRMQDAINAGRKRMAERMAELT